MQTQTSIQFVISTDWQQAFETYLRQDYRKISPTHRNPSEKTVKAACQHVRVFSMWWEAKFGEDFVPEKLTNFDLHTYRHHSLEEARVAPDTWNSRLWALRIFATWIHARLGDSYADLADGVETKEQGLRPSRYRSLTDQEYGRLVHRLERRMRESNTALFIQYKSKVRDRAMISIMLNAGLRVEEVSMLDVQDIKLGERGGNIRVRDGKGDKERIISLNLKARGPIRDWMAIKQSIDGPLFDGKNTKRISVRQIERIISHIGAECGTVGMSPHWLRYTFAKNLERAGTLIEDIRDLLGHESIETTRRYLRSSFEELQSVLERI